MEQLFALWEFMGRECNIPALPLCHVVPQEHCHTRIHAHALAPVGFPGSRSPCRELPSQQAAHLQRGIHRRTILIRIFFSWTLAASRRSQLCLRPGKSAPVTPALPAGNVPRPQELLGLWGQMCPLQ